MPSLSQPTTGPAYWRSLDELAGTPEFREFVAREFPHFAPELLNSPTRRQFLKIMGAALALAGLTGCRWPEETIVPYADRPKGRTPGQPVQYATAMEVGGVATGLLVTSYDGRPIKIEGNEQHPFSRGKTNALQQASVLELYDPDRSRFPVQGTTGGGGSRIGRTWDDFVAFAGPHFAALRERQGAGFCVLSEASASPSLLDMTARLLRAFPQARWYEYEPLSRDNEREGARLAFGKPYRTHLHLDQADVIVSLEADFLMTHPAAVKYAGDFAARRRAADGTMNRLYVFESNVSVTGTMADHRYPVRSSQIAAVVNGLQVEMSKYVPEVGGRAKQSYALPVLAAHGSADTAISPAALAAIAKDLVAHRGRCVVVVGPRQPVEIHALVHELNASLGAVGTTITYTDEADPERPCHTEAVAALARDLSAGRVDTLLILGGNPVFDLPADVPIARALGAVRAQGAGLGGPALQDRGGQGGTNPPGVETSIHLSLFDNETSQICSWHLPRAHYLESWGDARAYDGTVSIIQPLIAPLYEGKTPAELLALLAGDDLTKGYDIVRRTFRQQFAKGREAEAARRQALHDGAAGVREGILAPAGNGDAEAAWRRALHDGVVAGTQWSQLEPALRIVAAEVREGILAPAVLAPVDAVAAGVPQVPAGDGFEVVFVPDYSVYDGRFANNGWLQEWPDPITKLTWDNAALLSPTDAQKLGFEKYGDMLRIEHNGAALEIAAYPLPGHASGTITIPLGYGRKAGGRVAAGAGVNAYPLMKGPRVPGTEGPSVAHLRGAQVTATGQHYKLASTQDHHAIRSDIGDEETARRVDEELVRVETLENYKQNPGFAKRKHPAAPLWREWDYSQGHKWGMAIDLSACIGCGACVVACQAENNIPVVGKDEVARGREMHWMRVDRYFQAGAEGSGSQGSLGARGASRVQVVHQPLTCHHCETAPCEQVCPVAATVHDQEGLNVMVYNRCIGTRYCSNNCPFKVRRFNWFWNQHGPKHPRAGQELTEIEKMVMNPEVTVRSRGVMEKCSFCVQRISAVKIVAKSARWASIPDGAITPACAQACPTGAIVFGDLNDPASRVRKLHEHERSYELLGLLHLKPRLRYLAKLRNPAGNSVSKAGNRPSVRGAKAEEGRPAQGLGRIGRRTRRSGATGLRAVNGRDGRGAG